MHRATSQRQSALSSSLTPEEGTLSKCLLYIRTHPKAYPTFRASEEAYKRLQERANSARDPARFFDEAQTSSAELEEAFRASLFQLGASVFALMHSTGAFERKELSHKHVQDAAVRALEQPSAPSKHAPSPPPVATTPSHTAATVKPPPTVTARRAAPRVTAAPAAPRSARVTREPSEPTPASAPTRAPATAAASNTAPAAPMTSSLRDRLQKRLNSGGLRDEADAVSLEFNPDVLGDIKSRLGSPCDHFDTDGKALSELGTLRAVTRDEEMDQWASFPSEIQQALVGVVTARARALQDEVPSYEDDEELGDIFSRLSRFSKANRPGFVHGLRRDHVPRYGTSWRADVHHWLTAFHDGIEPYLAESDDAPEPLTPGEAQARLEALLEDTSDAEAIQAGVRALMDRGMQPDTRIKRLLACVVDQLQDPAFKNLRRAVRDQLRDDEDASTSQALESLGPEWGLWWKFHGKRACLVGGNPRHELEGKIQAYFGFSQVEWLAANKGMRKIQALANGLQSGSAGWDVVFVLTDFVSHSISEMLKLKDVKTLMVSVHNGYGLQRLRHAAEDAAKARYGAEVMAPRPVMSDGA